MSNYIPNNLLKENVEKKDSYAVRGALVALILTDSSFSKGVVYQAIKYAEENGIAVYQEHDSSTDLIENSSGWNEEYFAKVANQLRRNFSKERLSHLEKVGKKVYVSQNETAANRTTTTQKANVQPKYTSQQSQTRRAQPESKKNFITGRQALAIAAAGIAVAAIIILIAKN